MASARSLSQFQEAFSDEAVRTTLLALAADKEPAS
jgi:hypothetical protein